VKYTLKKMCVGLVCLAAVGAVQVSAASAEICNVKAGSTKYTLCVEGQRATANAEVTTALKSTNATLEFPEAWGGEPRMSWVCSHLSQSAEFGTGGEAVTWHSSGATFSGCALHGRKKCLLPTTEATRGLSGHFTTGGEGVRVEQESGGTIISLAFKSVEGQECPSFFNKKSVVGSYQCKLHDASVEQAQHEFICESLGAETFIFGEEGRAAPLRYTQTISLGGANKGKKFSIYERS
jgi:hypothetical protein